jgi:hypothetical protein
MKLMHVGVVIIAVLLLGTTSRALAEGDAEKNVTEINQALQVQEQTISELSSRIRELEGDSESSSAAPAAGPVPEAGESGEAPSPMEQVEAEEAFRYGRQARVTFRNSFDDMQGPAARASDYTLNPEHRGFITIPRTAYMVKFSARPRLDMLANSANAGSEFRFVPAKFPVNGQPGYEGGWRFNANANGSQLRMDVQAPSVTGNFRFYYQNDFFGSDEKHMNYRLQHLYGQFHGVVGGFTYGVFEDPDAWPDTVDYEAPNAVVFARRALVQYKKKLTDDWQLTLSAENPDSYVDTTTDLDAVPRNRAPDTGFNVRWTPGKLGHMQFSSIFRSIGVDGDTFDNDDVFGWGLNLSGSLNVTSNDSLQFWFVYGQGVGGMGNDASFVDGDAAFDAAGNLVALEYWSTLAALTHHWTPRWRSTATYGYVNLENTDGQDPTTFHLSHYASANLMYQIFKRFSIGLEGLYGFKEVKSGADSSVYRIQLGLAFSFFD